jgi:2-polyprenyl-3-methyl-5-hydroxy-6-metoxy-1,4-benzoquinol methylase
MTGTSTTAVICPVTGRPAQPLCQKDSAEYYIEKQSKVIFQHPMPVVTDMAAYADSEYASGAYKSYFAAKSLKVATAQRRLTEIERLAPGKRLLDIGCSVGFFMETAQNRGFEVTGIEFSKVAISMAVSAVKNRIICGNVNTLLAETGTQYDVVTAFDIIEHTQDPVAFINDVNRCLAPGGLLVMTTPDTGHFLRVLMGKAWPMLQPMQHTVLFSQPAMAQMLDANGFSDIDVRTTPKVMTIEYLGEQLRETNPGVAKIYDSLSWILPRSLKAMPMGVNIGEFIVFARKLN